MAGYISPGTGGGSDIISRGSAPWAGGQHPITGAPLPSYTRRGLEKGHYQVFRPKGSMMKGTHVGSLTKANIYIRGLDAVIFDLEAVSEVWQDLTWQVNDFTGEITVHNARQTVPIDTGATYQSIHYNHFSDATGMGVDVGPTTFYAPWLEFGTVRMAPRPFMTNAFELNKMPYVHAMYEVAMVAADLRNLTPPYDTVAKPVIRNFRTWLYDKEKALGNIAAFGMRPLLSGPRSLMLNAARAMGDIQSFTGGWAGRRITDRLSGKITGHVIGAGRVGLSTGKSYSAFIGGSVGHRIYQTHAGKYARMATGLK